MLRKMIVEDEKERVFPEAKEELASVFMTHQFEIVKQIGKGSSAIVYLVRSIKYQQDFALKRILNTPTSLNKHDEIQVLHRLCDPGIIRFYAFDIRETYSYLFFEYCPNESVKKYLYHNGPFGGHMMMALAKTLLQSLAYIHEHQVAHCDIKPENLLIDIYGRIKYADFGLSNLFPENISQDRVGSAPYMSPELINSKAWDPFAADIWALGITLYFMHTGNYPWPKSPKVNIKYFITHYDVVYPQTFSKRLRNLLKRMLCPLSHRETAAGLLKDPVFETVDVKEAKIPVFFKSYTDPHIPLGRAATLNITRNIQSMPKSPNAIRQFATFKKPVEGVKRMAGNRRNTDILLSYTSNTFS